MQSIIFEIKNNIAFITLNRPEKFNSFNREMALSLQERLKAADSNKEVRCVYITGAGKSFCAGQDLAEVAPSYPPPTGEMPLTTMDKILVEHFNPIIKVIRNLSKPVVAAVNGVAAGAGANIALCCDVVIAAESSSFIQAFSKIGLIPDSGGTFFLPRLIGFQNASALMMLGDKISGADAQKTGMVYKVFSDETFKEESIKIAETLSTMPTRALYFIKQALNRSLLQSLEEQLKTEDEFQQKAAATDDFKEGVQAFLEKRKPIFKGE